MKKRTMALLLCATMAVAVTGCGKKSDANNSVADTETEVGTEINMESQATPAYAGEIEYDPNEYVTLGDYNGMQVTLTGNYEVTDEDVKNEIEQEISSAKPYYIATDKKTVEDGDVVNIDYVGTKDGEAFQGGSATGYDLEIGSGSFIDGFESGLIGSKVGDQVVLNLTFPENYQSTDLAGQAVEFTVTVNQIEEAQDMSYDELCDEYTSSVMGYDTVDVYKEAVKNYLMEDAENKKTADLQTAVLNKLLEICEVNGYPDGLVEERINERKEYYESYATAYGMDLATFLSNYVGMTEEQFEEQLQESIPDAVSQEMILLAIADKEGIADDKDTYNDYIEAIVTNNGFNDTETLFSSYDENYVKRMYCQDTALSFLTDQVEISYDTVGTENTEVLEDTES